MKELCRKLGAGIVAVLAGWCAQLPALAQDAPADFTIHSLSVVPNPPHAGFNAEFNPYYSDITDNIWSEDGAFAPMDVRGNFTIDSGTTTTAVVTSNGGTDVFNSITSGFFVGAKTRIYRYSGTAWTLLRSDTVTGYTAVTGSTNAADHTITFAASGPAVQAGDIIWLSMDAIFNLPNGVISTRLSASGNLLGAWNPIAGSGSVLTYVADGAPGATYGPIMTDYPAGMQITSTGTGTNGMFQYIQGLYPTMETWETGHTYQADVWLKQNGIANASATFSLNHGGPSHTFTGLTGTWQKYTYQFPAQPGLTAGSAAVDILLTYTGSGTLTASQFFVHDAATPAFTTDSRVTTALQNFKPGTMRIWSAFSNWSGAYSFLSLESFLAPESGTRGIANLGSPYRITANEKHLPAALQLCTTTGATPWIIANMSWSEKDWYNLMDYLCAPAGVRYAIYRPSSHPGPYINDFSQIYIEFGNEEWGSQKTAWNVHYGQAANLMVSSAMSNPYFSSKVKFIVNGFTGNPTFGPNAAAACPAASVVDYFNYTGSTGSGDALYQADLLSLPSAYQSAINGWMSTEKASATAGFPYTVAAYEGGPGNDVSGGAADNSLAAAVGALDVHLYGALSGIGPQNFFAYNTGVGSYTSHTDISRGFIPHVIWEALQMRNNYCNGDMVAIDTNTVPVTADTNKYPLTSCYVFKDSGQADVVVISRDLNNTTPVSLHLPAAPSGAATLYTLTGDPRTDNNTALTIPIATSTIPAFTQNYTFTMPPGSIYLFQVPMTWPGVGPSGLVAAGGNNQVVLTWSAYTGATSYNVYRSTTAGAEGNTPYASGITGTTYTDNATVNGTTYYYKLTAVVSGTVTDQSSQSQSTPLAFGTILESNACAQTTGTLPPGWSYDTGFGASYTLIPFVNGTVDVSTPNAAPAAIYADARGSASTIDYTITGLKPNSPYTVRMHFVDGNGTPTGERLMNVIVNGVQLLTNFDIRATVGMKAVVKDLPTEADGNGKIAFSLVRVTTPPAIYQAAISGFQIITGH